jgi:Cu+-exporting ATPase
MSDKFSLDDILSEIDNKKSGVKPPSYNPPFSDEADSLTAEIADIERLRFGGGTGKEADTAEIIKPDKAKVDLSVTQILNEAAAKKDTAELPEMSQSGEVRQPVPVQIKRFTPAENPSKKKKIKEKKKKDSRRNAVEEVPEIGEVTPEIVQVAEILEIPAVVKAVIQEEEESETLSKTIPIPMTPEKTFSEIADDVVPVEKPGKPAYLLPEEKERLQKIREEELLEKELALEESDDLLDSMNVYDVKEIETEHEDADEVDVKLTQDVVQSAPTTIETPVITDKPVMVDDSDEVKEYTPLFDIVKEKAKEREKKKKKKSENDSYKKSLDNSALVESLNESLAKKRASDKDARRTLAVDTLSDMRNREDYKGKTIPAKLNIDYKRQIIEDSSVLPQVSDLLSSKQLEERELGKKKKRKIRDFILEDIEDEDDFEYEEDDREDYDGYDSSNLIWQDLNESHKGLKWRFALLLLLVLGLTGFTFIHDTWNTGTLPWRQAIIDRFFEGDNLTGYATTFVFVNLIVGVVGMMLCSGVILRGLKNLFIGKADCDSACAVPIVLTTAAAVVHISSNASTALLQQGKAHIYVVAGLSALMFNTLGKIVMIVRAKKNFKFISGDSVKYSAHMPNAQDDSEARVFTKGIQSLSMPAPVFLRKTEFLTDYLKNSYCTDWADLICRKLVPISAILAIVMGITAYFLPVSDAAMAGSMTWAVTAGGAFIAALSPFTIMFIVNNPLLKAAKSLSKSDSVVMGYTAAQRFSKANAVVVDANMLFPAGSIKFLNVKRCQKPNAINSVSIDESIIIAASLAIKSNSILSSMFYDMISGDSELLYKIENCIYEANMGILGWMGSKRVMLGNRQQMKHHGVDVPAENKERRHCPENGDVVYLAVGSETVAMFFIEVVPNGAVKASLWDLDAHGIALAVKTKDSLVTVNKLADLFELNPERVKILPFDQHSSFDDYSGYVSRGSSEIACNGTFTSFARALVTAKSLIRDMMVTSAALFVGVFIAGMLGLMFVIFALSWGMSATAIMGYNLVWLGIMVALQTLRRY